MNLNKAKALINGTNENLSTNDVTSSKLINEIIGVKLNLENCLNKIEIPILDNQDIVNDLQAQNGNNVNTINYEDGSVYTGEIVNGKKHGKGKLYLSDTLYYDGNFVNDMYEGQGKLLLEHDMIYEGSFSKGLRNGYGIQYNTEKTYVYNGDWKEGNKDGNGYFYNNFRQGEIS